MEDNRLKNPNIGNLDDHQMINHAFDCKRDAFRVSVVDGVNITVDQLTIPELKFPEQSPVVIKEQIITEVQVPVIIKEIQLEKLEVPVIIKETEVKVIENQVIIPELKIVEIEKPIIIKETEIKYIEKQNFQIPTIVVACMVLQTIALIGLLITKLV